APGTEATVRLYSGHATWPNGGTVTDIHRVIDRRAAASQRQFLDIVDAETAGRRFQGAVAMAPVGREEVELARVLHRVLAEDVIAPVDVPAFDRTNVDGFAVNAADTAAATEDAPVTLALGDEVVTPGVVPEGTVTPGTATLLATGGIIPRGADAVIMV